MGVTEVVRNISDGQAACDTLAALAFNGVLQDNAIVRYSEAVATFLSDAAMSDQPNLFDTDPAPWELDDANEQQIATLVFAVPPYGPYDYAVPQRLHAEAEAGRRMKAPLGRGNRGIQGYCVNVEYRTTTRKLKEIQSVVDPASLLSPAMLRLTKWMAETYLCEWGQAIEAVVPAGVRGKAGTREMTFLSVPNEVVARLATLKLPKMQAAALMLLAGSAQPMTPPELAKATGCTIGPINALRKKKLVREEQRRVQQGEHAIKPEEKQQNLLLNADQQNALDTIHSALHRGAHETILMHGVTGSGKTEVYIRAIEEVLSFGRQAIVLVPEISLTPQTRQRFRSRFEHVAVLHSHLSDPERHWHWRKIASGETQVVVGARSAVFAPAPDLGLIIIDEEHDNSFKQDIAPRYNARDVALFRAQTEKAPLVLGSATPALESWVQAETGKFKLVEMPRRVNDLPLPLVDAIDLRAEFQSQHNRGAISRPLISAMREALADGGQVILLLNRRGFSTNIQCPSCGYVLKCPDCDISLTHHREGDRAVCHYCEHEIAAPPVCPECRFNGINYAGLGTQRLESEVAGRFKDYECLRMDSDSMRKPGSHEAALERFRSGEVKILVGTQMIAKGLDFPDVTLVGVINADTALHFPDFRAAERTFQLVTQVAGRTGRGKRGGRVLVQTFSPEHPAIQAAMHHDYKMFAATELPLREEFGYPPYEAMIRLVVRGPQEQQTETFADHLADEIREAILENQLDGRVLGPAAAPLAKLRGKFRFHALIQGADADELRTAVKTAAKDIQPPDDVQFIFDVDPQALL